MNKYVACLLPALLLAASCQSKQEKKSVYVPKSLHMEARIDRSEPVQIIDVEKALQNPAPLKLSQIFRTATLSSRSTIRASTTASPAERFRASGTDSRRWTTNGTRRWQGNSCSSTRKRRACMSPSAVRTR